MELLKIHINIIFIIIILLLVIASIYIFLMYNKKDYYENQYTTIGVKKYYDNINDLLEAIENKSNILIFVKNGLSGFCSQLTIYMQINTYIKSLNINNAVVLPLFDSNSRDFKYHDETVDNSFFLYFNWKLKKDISTYDTYYFIANPIDKIPFFSFTTPIISNENNKKMIDDFRENFEITDSISIPIKEYVTNIKKEKNLIGIHIRSLYQKRLHSPDYMNIDIKTRLEKVKTLIDFKEYNIFIATDVISYITISKQVFGDNIYYLPNIDRINNDDYDSIATIDKNIGFKLGSDILSDCLALSMCDIVYVSNSNIPFVISIFNPSIKMVEY